MVGIKEIENIMECIQIKNKVPREKRVAIYPSKIVFGNGMYEYSLKCNLF